MTAVPVRSDSGAGVAELFADQVAQYPDAAAVVAAGTTVSYQQLAAEAAVLTAALRARGIGMHDRVAVSLPPGIDQIAAVLAILACGAAYVPIDPAEALSRREHILADAAVSLHITAPGADAGAEAVTPADLRAAAADGAAAEAEAGAFRPVPVAATTPIYVMYTSGTTGRPKGVELTHGGVVNLLAALVERAELADVRRVLYRTRFSFDASIPELLLPLAFGKTIIVASDSRDVDAALQLIAKHRIDMVTMVPSLASVMLAAAADLTGLAHVRRWLSVGEALPARTARDLLGAAAEVGGQLQLYNMYGPTEASVFVTGCRVLPEAVADGSEKVSLGTPLAGCGIRILQPGSTAPAPAGAVGEICITGRGVGLGYLGMPDSPAFTYAPDTGEPMYRTGDLGLLSAGDELEYWGRIDDQAKIRGHRIELAEVDAALAALPQLRDAGAAVQHRTGHPTLVAAVVPAEQSAGQDPEVLLAAVTAALTQTLPGHMIPTRLIVSEALPLNENGKLDRAAIAELAAAAGPRRPAAAGDPLTPREAAIADVFAQVLGLPDSASIAAADTVYELGFDSLTATLALGALRAAGIEVPLHQLLAGGSVRELAATSTSQPPEAAAAGAAATLPPPSERPASGRTAPADLPDGVDADLPLTPIQQGILTAAEQDASGHSYIVQQVFDVAPGRLQPERLKPALLRLSERHAVLRTRLVISDDGAYRQIVEHRPHASVTIAEGLTLQEAQARIAADRRTPFDLSAAPLLRLTWLTGPAVSTLILTYHHVILDGLSQDLLMAELLAEHDAATPADPAAVSEETQRHVSRMQLLAAQGDIGSDTPSGAAHAHFRQLFAGFDDQASLAHFASQHPDGEPIGSASVPVPEAELAGITDVAAAHGTTVSTVVEAAWAILLQQFSGTRDVIYAKAVTRRDVPVAGTAQALGPLLNTVPMRAAATADTRVSDLLRDTHLQSASVAEHSGLRLDRALRAGGLSAAQAQTLYLFERHSDQRAAVEAAGIRLRPGSTEQTGFGLSLLASQSPQGLLLTGLCNGLDMSAADVTALLERVIEILRAITSGTDPLIAALPTLIGEDSAVIAADVFDNTPSPYPRVEEAFAQTVAKHPHACAVRHGSRRLSYRELDAVADGFAGQLQAAGVQAGDIVGVIAGRAIEPLASLLAVLRLGAAYVPLDISLPPERLAHIAASTQLRVIISWPGTHTGPQLHELCAELGATVIELNAEDPGDAAVEPVTSAAPGDIDAPAYVIYTSGTTGMPKGVVVPHRGITRLVLDAGYARLDAHQTVLHTSAMTFDVSTLDIWGAWLNGASLVITDQETLIDSVLLKQVVAAERISFMWLTTSLFNLHAETDPSVWDSVATLMVGGEKLSAPHVRALFDHNAATVLINGYGPTEATTLATSHIIERNFTTLPIGRAIPRTGAHVVSQGRAVGRLLPGELWLTGDGVALGYLDDPERTGRAFVDSPMGDGIAYRTGDLVRRNLDGTLEYLGRLDDQVKIRGHRVETGEIVEALAALPEVVQAAVLVYPGADGGSELAAFAVPAQRPGRAPVDAAGLRERLSAILPSYAIPAQLQVIPEMPLTTAGKVDRSALSARLTAAQQDRAPHAGAGGAEQPAHSGRTHGFLEQLFSTVLGGAAVGPDANFYALGGDSLAAMRLVHLLRRAGVDVSLRQVLAAATPRQLAELLDIDLEAAEAPHPAPPAAPAGAGSPAEPVAAAEVPGSGASTRPVWPTALGAVSAQLREPASTAYNIPFGLLVTGRVDASWLEARLQQIVRRHPLLRTGFELHPGPSLVQRTLPPAAAEQIRVTSSADQPVPQNREEAETVVRGFAQPFDLSAAPLLRAHIMKGEDRSLVLVDTHHSVVDGTSLDVIIAALAAEHTPAEQQHTPAEHSSAEQQPGPVAVPAEAAPADVEHWQQTYAHPPEPVALQLAWEAGDDSLGVLHAQLPRTAAQALRRRCQELGLTEYAVFAAAAAVLIQRYTFQEDLVIGMPVDTRPSAEAAQTAGMWVNTVPVRLHADETAPVGQLLQATGAAVLSGIDHAGVPLHEIQSAVRAHTGIPAVDLVQVVLAYRRIGKERTRLNGAAAEQIGPLSVEAKVDLEFTVDAGPDGCRLGIEHRRSAVDDEAAAGMLEQFAELVSEFSQIDIATAVADVGTGEPPLS